MLGKINNFGNLNNAKNTNSAVSHAKNIVNINKFEPKKPEFSDIEKKDKFDSKKQDGPNIVKNKFAPAKKDTPALSEAAQSLLEELKKSFGNVDFIVSDFSNDYEAQKYLRTGKGEFNCVITPDLLEKMAADAEIRSKYESMIDESVGELKEVKEKAKPEVAEIVKNYGVSFDNEGNITYYALLNKGLPKDSGNSNVIKANTIESLLKLLEEIAEKRKSDEELRVIITGGDEIDPPETSVDTDVSMDFKA